MMKLKPTTWATQRGEALRAARRAAGLTQEQLAVALGCSRNTVSCAERGKHQLADDLTDSWWRITRHQPQITLAAA
jgi:DNA-binding XRE family transcriptional regulator